MVDLGDGADREFVADPEPGEGLSPAVEMIEDDGYLIDARTGEVLGLADPGPSGTMFDRGSDLADADWILSILMREAAAIQAIEAQRDQILTNLLKIQDRHARRAKFLQSAYTENLKAVAAAALAGKKTRTLTLPHGELSFRKKPGRCEIPRPQMAEAVAWAEDFHPELIRTKTESWVPAREALDAYMAWADAQPEDSPVPANPPWAQIEEPYDSFTIKVGMGAKGIEGGG